MPAETSPQRDFHKDVHTVTKLLVEQRRVREGSGRKIEERGEGGRKRESEEVIKRDGGDKREGAEEGRRRGGGEREDGRVEGA